MEPDIEDALDLLYLTGWNTSGLHNACPRDYAEWHYLHKKFKQMESRIHKLETALDDTVDHVCNLTLLPDDGWIERMEVLLTARENNND